jgi:hypothetical protein
MDLLVCILHMGELSAISNHSQREGGKNTRNLQQQQQQPSLISLSGIGYMNQIMS